MLKLFNLEVKDNDPMLVAYEIRAIMHAIQASGIEPYLPLASFLRPSKKDCRWRESLWKEIKLLLENPFALFIK